MRSEYERRIEKLEGIMAAHGPVVAVRIYGEDELDAYLANVRRAAMRRRDGERVIEKDYVRPSWYAAAQRVRQEISHA